MDEYIASQGKYWIVMGVGVGVCLMALGITQGIREPKARVLSVLLFIAFAISLYFMGQGWWADA
jgi:hypothetical protein